MALQDCTVLVGVAVVLSLIKTMMVKTYRSTDYEVHRNWLAITHSLPLERWYTEDTSEWTLDYPPFFAWFEFTLSQFAPFFDREMLKVMNLNYTSEASILFHRFTVIAADFLYLYAAYHFSITCVPKRNKEAEGFLKNPKLVTGVLLMANFGLFIIDHIHFQYNGFLFGLLLLSITAMYQARYMTAALHFATLLNFKHIFLYIAPAYGIYLLRVYCFSSSKKDGSVIWTSFSFLKFSMLGGVVIMICGMSFGPFIYLGQLGQVISRLFPFKRGLCHAYWAPNFWTLYNLADKILYTVGRRLDMVAHSNSSAVMTGGLVQEFNHSVLPSVSPLATFLLTAAFMIPTIIHLWLNPTGPRAFLRSMILCGFTSFMFGWHVHEKAILLVIIPMILLATDSREYSRHFILISITGHVSLFPLIFTKFEQPILYSGMTAYTIYSLQALNQSLSNSEDNNNCISMRWFERMYLYTLPIVVLYYAVGHSLLGLTDKLPFLPLLIISVYTSIGVTYTYISLYATVLHESMIIKMKRK